MKMCWLIKPIKKLYFLEGDGALIDDDYRKDCLRGSGWRRRLLW